MSKNVIGKKKSDIEQGYGNTDCLDHLTHLLSRHPPSRLSRNLRTMLLEFLQHDDALEAPYLKDLLFDLQGLFELLEGMEK